MRVSQQASPSQPPVDPVPTRDVAQPPVGRVPSRGAPAHCFRRLTPSLHHSITPSLHHSLTPPLTSDVCPPPVTSITPSFRLCPTSSRRSQTQADDLRIQHFRSQLSVFQLFRGPLTSVLCPLLLCFASFAQEALQNSQAGEAAALALRKRQEDQPYSMRMGDFKLLVRPSIGIDFNDNINTSQSHNQQSDIILRPMLDLSGLYPITDYNALRVSVGVGYDEYLDHSQYSRYRLDEGSQLDFDLFVKSFWINLHDRFQSIQDPALQPGFSGGYVRYGGLYNTAGLTVTWDLKDYVLTLGYDHFNFIASDKQYEYLSRSSELPIARAGFRFHPTVTAGVEASVSPTTYDQKVLNDNTGYSGGLYADWQPGTFFHVQARGGYATYKFQQTSLVILAKDENSYYASLTATHQVNETISYAASVGHELRLGITADIIEATYLRPSVTWKAIRNLPLTALLTYEHGSQAERNVAGTYDYFGADLGLSYLLMKKLTVSANYRFTLRQATGTGGDYTQNLLGLRATYQF